MRVACVRMVEKEGDMDRFRICFARRMKNKGSGYEQIEEGKGVETIVKEGNFRA